MRIVPSHILIGCDAGKTSEKGSEKEKFWVLTKAFQYNHSDKGGGWGLSFLQSSEGSVLYHPWTPAELICRWVEGSKFALEHVKELWLCSHSSCFL